MKPTVVWLGRIGRAALTHGIGLALGAVVGPVQAQTAGAGNSVGGGLLLVAVVAQDDPRLERSRLERSVPGHATGPAADGLRLALKDHERVLQAAGLRLDLQVLEVANAQEAARAVKTLDAGRTVAVLSDLPEDGLKAVVM